MFFKNQLKAGVILSYLSLLMGNAVSLIYTPIMLRLLGQNEFGLYSLVSSFVAYLGLMDLGFSATYLRFYTQYKHSPDPRRVDALNGTFFIVFGVIAVLTLFCGLILCQYSNQIFGDKLNEYELITAKKLMYLLVINMTILFGTKIFEICIVANECFVFAKLTGLIKNLLNPLLILPFLLMGCRAYGMVMVSLVISTVFCLFNVLYCFSKLGFRIKVAKCEKKLYGEIASISAFVFIGEIVDQINWNVGKYILGRTCGTVAVAVYGLAVQFLVYYRSFSSCISSVFVPRVNKMIATTNNNADLTDLMIKIGRIQFIILTLFATGFIFSGKTFCCLWAGSDYSGTFAVTLALMLPTTVPLIQNVGIAILIAKNRHRARSFIYLAIAIANICITIPLSIKYGALGCAMGTAISMIVGNGIIMNWYYHYVGLDMIRFWRSIFQLSRGLILPCLWGSIYLVAMPPLGWLGLMMLMSSFVVVFFLSMRFCGFNDYEKELLAEYWNRLLQVFCRNRGNASRSL